MQLTRAAEENAVLLCGTKLCQRAASVSERLCDSCGALLQTLRHYMAGAADQAELDDATLRNMKVRCPTLQRCPPCHKGGLASSA